MDKFFNDNFRKIYENQYSNGFKMGHDKFTIHKGVLTDKGEKREISYISTLEDFIYCFKGYEDLRYNTSTGKLFMYAISNLDSTNIAKFYANDYLKLRGFSRTNNGIEQIKADVEQLVRIDGIVCKSSKSFLYANLIISVKYHKKYVYVEFNNEFVDYVKQMYFWLPNTLFKTKDKYAPHAWSIGYELFKYIKSNKHARQKKVFSRNIISLIKYSNLQNLIDTDRQKEYLFIPLVKSLNHLNEIQDNIEIEIPEYHPDFKNKSIEIKVMDEMLIDCYNNNAQKTLDENQKNKTLNIKKTWELKKRGYTNSQISLELKVSTRTVRNYLKEIS